MSVRSRYSASSYANHRPGSATHAARHREQRLEEEKNVPVAPPTSVVMSGDSKEDLPELCKQCYYKQIVDSAIKREHGDTAATASAPSPVTATGQSEPEDPKKVGIFTKFQRYVAKNQAANRKAGDTPLMDDLVKWGGNLASGAASLGQEEMDYLERKKKTQAVSRRDRESQDEETLDFLMGKKHKSD